MKSKFNWIWILAGILLVIYGLYQEIQYSDNSVSVTATITHIKSGEDNMGDVGGDEYMVYYGEYILNGKRYSDVRLASHSGKPKYEVGDTLSVQVDGSQNGKVAKGGQGQILIGGVLILLGIGDMRKKKEE